MPLLLTQPLLLFALRPVVLAREGSLVAPALGFPAVATAAAVATVAAVVTVAADAAVAVAADAEPVAAAALAPVAGMPVGALSTFAVQRSGCQREYLR